MEELGAIGPETLLYRSLLPKLIVGINISGDLGLFAGVDKSRSPDRFEDVEISPPDVLSVSSSFSDLLGDFVEFGLSGDGDDVDSLRSLVLAVAGTGTSGSLVITNTGSPSFSESSGKTCLSGSSKASTGEGEPGSSEPVDGVGILSP